MSRIAGSLLPVALVALFAVNSLAQTADPPTQTPKSGAADLKTKKSKKDVSQRLDALQSRLDQAQAQIQQQQLQIERLQKSLQATVQQAGEQSTVARNTGPYVSTDVAVARNMGSDVTKEPNLVPINKSLALEPGVGAVKDPQVENPEGPDSIAYKGLKFTPGGFLEATALVRNRNENADFASTYTGSPLNGTSNSHLSEFRGSVRDSRLDLLIQGKAGSTNLSGYVEGDFLGAAPTANYVQSSGWTPRLRQLFVQADWASGWTLTAGQFWSLITTNRKGIETRTEFVPNVSDGTYSVGYNWVRERSIRLTRNFNDKTWIAFEYCDPQTTYSAAFVPANIMGLNTSVNAATGVSLLPFLENYSFGIVTALAPDLVAKIAYEPGWGHFEIKALGRFFRDRIASTATTVGQKNTSEGYGVGFGAILPVVRNKVDVIVEGLLGQGIGRYASAQLPDVTLNPVTGRMLPLREMQYFAGIEWRPTKKLFFYSYYGNEYAGRYPGVTSTGAPAGYGSQLFSYANCTNEVAMNTCSGANRDIYGVQAGYWYYLWQGRYGRFQYGNSVEYIHRYLWSGTGFTPAGSTPQGGDTIVYSTVRFYLP